VFPSQTALKLLARRKGWTSSRPRHRKVEYRESVEGIYPRGSGLVYRPRLVGRDRSYRRCKRKRHTNVHACCTRLADACFAGVVRARKGHENVTGGFISWETDGRPVVGSHAMRLLCWQRLPYTLSNPGGLPLFITTGQVQLQGPSISKPRGKRRKKARRKTHAANKTLLGPINKIITMRHLRVTRSKFSSLEESKGATNEEGELALPGRSATLGGPPGPLDYSGVRF
jgi:hypothetical protein